MRLLNVHTRELESFNDNQTPPYAIASHRWRKQEMTYKDFVKRRNQDSYGYRKVIAFCLYVCKTLSNINYLWIDTVCINKQDWAELGEAITSMFRWYQNSAICLAWLDDVAALAMENGRYADSEWWTRGWTLQELLAPARLVLISEDWSTAVEKGTQANRISNITGIDVPVIQRPSLISSRPIEERLSWISGRSTERVEDRAYCMLGICGVYLIINYGERDNAWQRLLEKLGAQQRKVPASSPFGAARPIDPPNGFSIARPIASIPVNHLEEQYEAISSCRRQQRRTSSLQEAEQLRVNGFASEALAEPAQQQRSLVADRYQHMARRQFNPSGSSTTSKPRATTSAATFDVSDESDEDKSSQEGEHSQPSTSNSRAALAVMYRHFKDRGFSDDQIRNLLKTDGRTLTIRNKEDHDHDEL